MKKILLTLFFITFNCQAEPVTIKKLELIGVWETHFGYGTKPNTGARIDHLNISKEFNVSYEMNFTSGKKQIVNAENTDFHVNNEFYIVTFDTGKETNFKLVFSGWVNGNEKLIFGMLYLYNNGQLFNGIPVSFKQSS